MKANHSTMTVHTDEGSVVRHVRNISLVVKRAQIQSRERTLIRRNLMREVQGPNLGFVLELKNLHPCPARVLEWFPGHPLLALMKPAYSFQMEIRNHAQLFEEGSGSRGRGMEAA